MANIEPGTYRIVNLRDRTAITIPGYNDGTIVGGKPLMNQIRRYGALLVVPCFTLITPKWFVRRSGNNYHIEDCVYGRYIVTDSTSRGARASLGRYPTPWEIVPLKANTYL
jgi:hypothetical protein